MINISYAQDEVIHEEPPATAQRPKFTGGPLLGSGSHHQRRRTRDKNDPERNEAPSSDEARANQEAALETGRREEDGDQERCQNQRGREDEQPPMGAKVASLSPTCLRRAQIPARSSPARVCSRRAIALKTSKKTMVSGSDDHHRAWSSPRKPLRHSSQRPQLHGELR